MFGLVVTFGLALIENVWLPPTDKLLNCRISVSRLVVVGF